MNETADKTELRTVERRIIQITLEFLHGRWIAVCAGSSQVAMADEPRTALVDLATMITSSNTLVKLGSPTADSERGPAVVHQQPGVNDGPPASPKHIAEIARKIGGTWPIPKAKYES